MDITCKLMAAGLLCALVLPIRAQSPPATVYAAADLMAPCQTADSDSREAGAAAEVACEQYVIGFVDALRESGLTGPGKDICPPPLNTGSEVRWAFIRWVYGDFTARRKMSAAAAMMGTLKDSFPCN